MKIWRTASLLPLLTMLFTCPLLASWDYVDEYQNYTKAFKGIATLRTWTKKAKEFKAVAVTPIFRSRTPLALLANRELARSQRRSFKEWLHEEAKEDWSCAPIACRYDSYPVLKHYEPSHLITLRLDSVRYEGRNHETALVILHNFGIVNGKPKELSLKDLFKPGTNYRKLVRAKLINNLKNSPAAPWVADGSVKTITDAQLKNFLISKTAVTWIFQEYEVGPYAGGQVEAKIPIQDLGPSFNQNLLAH